MSNDQICGALSCQNDADGYSYINGGKVWTCLECADKKGRRVIMDE